MFHVKQGSLSPGDCKLFQGHGDVKRGIFYYQGYVQGIGFRYNAKIIAERFSISGYVRNLSDGRVELIVEGDEEEIRNFTAAIYAHMQAHIHKVEERWADSQNEFNSFQVKF